MEFIYVTDLHGDVSKYEKTLDIAIKRNIKLIINGGDLCPKGPNRHVLQKNFIRTYLMEYARRVQELGIQLLLLTGNSDFYLVDPLLVELSKKYSNVQVIDKQLVKVEDYEVIGLNAVLDSPWAFKDRVVRELGYEIPEQKHEVAKISLNEGFVEINNWESFANDNLPFMEELLDRLPIPENPDKAIYVTHHPPYGTGLAMLSDGKDVGSQSLVSFIRKRQPLLTLHGHIHESPENLGGHWKSQIEKSICINPGQTVCSDRKMTCAIVNLKTMSMERHTG